jgi:acetylornithine deacetylase/succinyl-diaminopimelate desuccinylase-like protein
MQNIKKFVEANKQRMLDELLELLRFPSVSADPKYKADVLKTADYVAKKLTDSGADNVEVCPTAGYPIVYGEKIIDPTLPTVLVYGHYDVQPA